MVSLMSEISLSELDNSFLFLRLVLLAHLI